MASQTSDAVDHRDSAGYPFPNGTPYIRRVTHTLTSALALNEHVDVVPMFAGELLLQARILVLDQLDEHAAKTLNMTLGDSGDADRYANAAQVGTIVRTGGVTRVGIAGDNAAAALALNHVYTADDALRLTVTAAAADWRDVADAPEGALFGRIVVEATIIRP